jgi:peptide/nickel transport system permease protein
VSDESPFGVVSETETTPIDVVTQLFNEWVFAPLRIIWDDYRGRTGLLLLLVYLFMGTVGTMVWPGPNSRRGEALVTPFSNAQYPLGTDGVGEGLLSLMIHATPAMLKMIIAGVLVGTSVSIVVALAAGYIGGTVDRVLMTFTDVLMSIPGIPLLLILAAVFEPRNPYVVGTILSINSWAAGSRGMRAQVLALRRKEYVEASEAMGQTTGNILLKDILPELAPLITMGALGGATSIIQSAVGLYFLGILPFTTLNWGVVLNMAYQSAGVLYSPDAAHWIIIPLVTLTGLNFAFTMLAQSMDQVFNPRVRARHLRSEAEAEFGRDESETTTGGDELLQ